MKISTELRHIINSRFSIYTGERIPNDRVKHYFALAAKKQPELRKALDAFNKAMEQVKRIQKYMREIGIYLDTDGDLSINDESKFAKLINLPPRSPTRNEVLTKVASLSTTEGVAYLKTLGIDWS